MLVERRARAQERRVVPETIARFIREAADYASLSLKPVPGLRAHFRPGSSARSCCGSTSGRPTGGLRRSRRSTPAARPTGRRPRRTTWNGSRRAIRCSRPSAATFWRRDRRLSRLGLVSTRSLTRTRRGWTSTGRGSWTAWPHGPRADVRGGAGRGPGTGASRTGHPRRSLAGEVGPKPSCCLLRTPSATARGLRPRHSGRSLTRSRQERAAEVDRVARHVELSLTELLRRPI